MRVLVCAAALALMVLRPTAARAQPAASPAPADTEGEARTAEAKSAFERGLALFDREAWEAALVEFGRSRALHPTRAAAMNAALCLRKLRRFDEALDVFEALRTEFPAAPVDVKAETDREIDGLRKIMGTVVVEGADAGASVVIDGRYRGVFPLPGPLRIVAGGHEVRAFKERSDPFGATVEITAGKQTVARLRSLSTGGRLRVTEQRGRTLDVIIDGAVAGKTPWEGPLALGEHVVTLRGSVEAILDCAPAGGEARAAPRGDVEIGTQPVSVPIRLREVTTLTLAAEALDALIRIKPTPAGALVAIDGVNVGRGTWEGPLREGPHTVEVTADGFLPETRQVTFQHDKRGELAIVLSRDPRSPFWREPPRPPHLMLEVTAAVPVIASFGGDIVGDCTGACSAPPGVGFQGALQGGYELPSGAGFGVTLGVLTLRQKVSSRATTVSPVGLPAADRGAVDDTLSISYGGLAGAWAGYSVGSRFPVHLRLGAGALLASVTDVRSGDFTVRNGTSQLVGPVSDGGFVPYAYVAPEVRVGLRFGQHLEISVGIEVMVLLTRGVPTWSPQQQVDVGSDGIGTFSADRLIAPVSFVITPGVGARYDF